MGALIDFLPGRYNHALIWGGYFFTLLIGVIVILFFIDNRMVTGVNVWLKPLKFSISIAIFLITSAYLVEALPYTPFKSRLIAGLLIGTMLIEICCIIIQASRGQQSHFNITDPLGRVMFPVMGIAITMAYFTYLWILVDYIRLDTTISISMFWAIIIGISIFLFGAISGFTMAGNLGHNIGVADGGIGLPFTNWSTIGGDLRVSHFLSIHAIQMLPLTVIVMSRWMNLSPIQQLCVIVILGMAYASFSVLTFVQAMNGQPFLKLRG